MEDDEPLRLRVEAELREQGLSVAIDPASIGRIAALLGAQDGRNGKATGGAACWSPRPRWAATPWPPGDAGRRVVRWAGRPGR